MINQITGLFNKTDELEKYLDSFKRVQIRAANKTTCQSFLKNFSNFEVILPKKILLASVNATENSRIFFNALVEFSLPASEVVEFTFMVNDIAIASDQKTLNLGSNQVVIMRNYKPLASEKLDIYLIVKPKNHKTINLQMVSLFVWGDLEEIAELSYDAVETGENFVLSIIDNNSLYYKLSDKEKGQFSFSDFVFHSPAISHSFVYDEQSDTLLLFRVDTKGNLFVVNFFGFEEKILFSGVSKVSACSNNNGKFLVCIIKDNKCYYFEMDLYFNTSILKKFNLSSVKPIDAKCFYNKYNDVFCISLKDKNNSNYLVTELKDYASQVDNINVSYGILVETV